MKWVKFTLRGKKPPERRYVLVQLAPARAGWGSVPASVVVGYLRYAAGDRGSPYFVMPGVGDAATREVTHWCDCLGDDFDCPGWIEERRAHSRSATPKEGA